MHILFSTYRKPGPCLIELFILVEGVVFHCRWSWSEFSKSCNFQIVLWFMFISPTEEEEFKEDMDFNYICGDLETLDGKKWDHIPPEGAELCRSLPFNQMDSGCLDKGVERPATLQSGRLGKEFFFNPWFTSLNQKVKGIALWEVMVFRILVLSRGFAAVVVCCVAVVFGLL